MHEISSVPRYLQVYSQLWDRAVVSRNKLGWGWGVRREQLLKVPSKLVLRMCISPRISPTCQLSNQVGERLQPLQLHMILHTIQNQNTLIYF